SVDLRAGHPAGAVLAGNEPPLPVAGIPVGEVRGLAVEGHASLGHPAQHALVGNVAPDQLVGIAEPDGSFCPAAAAVELFQPRVGDDQVAELWIVKFILGGVGHAESSASSASVR